MNDAFDPEETARPDSALVLLKWLVIALTASMVVGIVTLIWLFATRLPKPIADLPTALELPAGETVSAITRGRGFVAVVTEGGEILIFDAHGTTLQQRIKLE